MPVVKFIERLDLEQISVDFEISHLWTGTSYALKVRLRILLIKKSEYLQG
jgi:hypothetical protein